jgi:hypothetical protein
MTLLTIKYTNKKACTRWCSYKVLLTRRCIPDRNEVKVRSYGPYPGTASPKSPRMFVLVAPDQLSPLHTSVGDETQYSCALLHSLVRL